MLKHSEASKEHLRIMNLGENNPGWKGYNAKINIMWLHAWVRKRIPKPEICPDCNMRPPYDLANMTGIYNRDLENWKYLCRSCHIKSDGRINNLAQNQPPARRAEIHKKAWATKNQKRSAARVIAK